MANNITDKPMEPRVVAQLAVYLLFVTILSGYLIISLWSSQRQIDISGPPPPNCGAGSTAQLTIHPDWVSVGAVGDVLLVGCQFDERTTTATVNGAPRQSQFVDSSHLRVGLTASDLSAVGTMVVAVSNDTAEFGTDTLNILPPVVNWRLFGQGPWGIHPEVQLLMLVLFTGVFGSTVYSLKSLGDYRGDNRLFESWHTFYVIQPFTGMGIAFLLYVVIRGGFLSGTGGDSTGVNQFGICAIAGLAGAFSDTAFLKLREVFQTLFKPQDDRSGKIGPKITTTALPDGTVGTVYNHTLEASGGVAPLKWSVTPALPSTMTLDPATGSITGTPTAALAKTKYTFTVTDSATPALSVSADLTFEVKAVLQVTTTALPDGIVGTVYDQTLEASGGFPPLKWSVTPALPSTTTLDPAGTVRGTPRAALAKTKYTFTVTDSAKPALSVSADLTFEVKAALRITTTALPEGVVETPYSQKLEASGGVLLLKWSVNPELPAGLALDPATGAISGTPTAVLDKTQFKFTITDSATPEASVTADLAFEIKPKSAAQTA